MGLLSNLSSIASRVPMVGGSTTALTPNALMAGAGVNSATTAIDQIIGPLGGYGPMSKSDRRDGSEAMTGIAPEHSVGNPIRTGLDVGASKAAGVPTIASGVGGQRTILRAGLSHAKWSNVFLACAMPAVLQLNKLAEGRQLHLGQARTQMALEVRVFRERLVADKMDWNLLTDASYLLCTFIDEHANDVAREQGGVAWGGERSLLVEYHGDAWGGEDAFADLQKWMTQDPLPRDLLVLYELLLSLGWQGRYRVIDNGDMQLQDLRSRLHALIWQHTEPEPLGTPLVVPSIQKSAWLTPLRALALLVLVVAALWMVATAYLDMRGRPVREALAAWTPPVRTIDIAETLPPPLPAILSEGWLTAYKHPQGWLLVFKSDGAFGVGRADVRPEFMQNIERLGLAMAPWQGDLEVIGHTDRQPIRASRFSSNQHLSEARARTVAEELMKTSLPGGALAPTKVVQRAITSSGKGDSEPVDPTDSAAAYSKNRRVDVLWKVVPQGRAKAWNESGSIATAAPNERDSSVNTDLSKPNAVNRDNP